MFSYNSFFLRFFQPKWKFSKQSVIKLIIGNTVNLFDLKEVVLSTARPSNVSNLLRKSMLPFPTPTNCQNTGLSEEASIIDLIGFLQPPSLIKTTKAGYELGSSAIYLRSTSFKTGGSSFLPNLCKRSLFKISRST